MCLFCFQYPMTVLYDPARKKEPSTTFVSESEACLKCFEKWSETEQVEFVENLLARMCHYQHGHINSYLKPMLQRDFISLLPSKYLILTCHWHNAKSSVVFVCFSLECETF